jgi:hypothetical protein
MQSAFADILTFPILLVQLAASAMGFSTDAFLRAAENPEAQTAALLIVFLAGVSEMLGQSVILIINRVVLYRFLASLLFTGATYVATALTWAAFALVIAPLTRVGAMAPDDIPGVIGVVSLAFAPRLLGVLTIAPYFGAALSNLLEAWAMVLAIFGLTVAFDMPFGAAILCGGAGWAASYALRSFLGHMLAKPLGGLRVLISGSPLDRTPQQIIDDVVRRIREGIGQ